jgi:anti-sigma-K factor RskA
MSDERTHYDEDLTAAEHALRLLSRDELRGASRREASDATFAERVARWRGRFAPFFEEIEPVVPPADLFPRIEAAVESRHTANDNLSVLRRRLSAWKAAAAAMTAIAASLALILLLEPRTAPTSVPPVSSQQAMVAILAADDGTKAVASWEPGKRQLILAVTGDMPVTSNQSPQLWVIPPGDKPHSLGLMPAGKQAHLNLAKAIAQLLEQGATIAVSVEPHGGSPTGAPTGPVIASGALNPA